MEGCTENTEGRQTEDVVIGVNDDGIILTNEGHKTKSYGISIDSTLIRSVPVNEQASALRDLNLNVFNQEEFEEGVLKQVDEAIAIQETEEVVRGWEKELKAVDEDVRTVESELKKIDRILCKPCASGYEGWRRAQAVRKQKDNKLRQLKKLEAKQKSLHYKLGIGKEEELESEGSGHFPQHDHKEKAPQLISEDQSEKDLLIKRGEMTPFGGIVQEIKGKTELLKESSVSSFAFTCNHIDQRTERHNLQEGMIRERSQDGLGQVSEQGVKETLARPSASKPRNCYDYDDNDDYVPEEDELKHSWYEDEDEAHEEKGLLQKSKGRKPSLNVSYTEADSDRPKTGRKKARRAGRKDATKPVDDGNEKMYRKRIRELRIKELLKQRVEYQANTTDEEDLPDMEFDKGLKIPGKIWHKLYKYQQTGVQWLWELHCQQAGGIVGDEMGLGKTIQMIVFLAGLKYSKISAKKSRHGGLGPVLIVCPVTVLHQWVQEFHKWWPEFRVAVLHETGTYQGFKQELIRKICSQNGVLVTSYSGVRQHQDHLLADRFDYVILDEGHKIRNPDAEITLACKQFRTSHRIILSGSPMQNNLRELWSLFDFVFPGKLGTLPVFMTEFSVPITMGGYSNATKVQVETAYKCACVLRDTINPYLLRRLKKDVKMSLELPSKNEQVLFCRLTDEQRELYQQYLDSREVQAILAGNYKVFPGLIMLRKICNHPDLTSVAGSLVKAKQDCLNLELEGRCEEQEPDPDEGYGDWRRSGKMIVVEALLKMWHQQGHRVLVFSQTRQMLNILETFVSSKGYTYFRMDGSTPVASRQSLINNFNDDDSVSLFLLTTRVGGLGVNLVGADRIIIYDPDWNPSTDTQARERAWRIGQSKPVTIYRLLTTGTIEEKIYHRQIFKQFLTNRVLKDPKQRRFFKSNDLFELFTLDSCDKRYGTETSAIFAGSNCEVKVPGSHKRKTKEARNWEVKEKGHNVKEVGARAGEKPSEKQSRDDGGGFCIDWRDVEETRNLAKKLDEREKNDEQHIETVGEKSDGKKSDGVEILCRQVETETSSGDVIMRTKDSSNVEISTALIHKNQTCILGKIDKKTNSECPRKENSIASECTVAKGNSIAAVSKQTCSSKSHVDAPAARSAVVEAAQSARLTSPKQRKKKISSLSDEELKKKLRLKEKKKKRRRAKLDGQRIENLDYHEIFNPQSTSQSSAEELDKNKRHNANQDEFILKQLFKKTGVHSALKHDVIMESSNPDLALVESEANRVAQNAVKALKRSRQRCLGASSGVPTWTGASGSSGISAPPPKRPRFGQKSSLKKSSSSTEELKKVTSLAEPKPHFSGGLMGMSSTTEESLEPLHSSQLLAKMRARNNLLASEETATQVLGDERDDLLVQIMNFIALHCGVIGQATTEEILNEFGSRLPKSDSTVFRSMLRQICTFTRDSTSGQGIWKLNPEFR